MTGTDIFSTLSPSTTQSYHDEYYYCDYVELLALANNEDFLSVSDVVQRFSNVSAEELVEEGRSAERTQRWEFRIESWFTILGSRGDAYGYSYPFVVCEGRISLKRNLSSGHLLYIFLLLCANQRHIHTASKSALTTEFEMISHRAMSNYLPVISKIYRCGKSMLSSARYTGHITNKIDKISDDLGMQAIYAEGDFASTNNGDFGLDLVAWVPFRGDPCKKSRGIYLAQCATGKDWLDKQHEARKIENCIPSLRGSNVDAIFIPHDARRANRDFQDSAKIYIGLVFDRFRMFHLLTHDGVGWVRQCKNVVDLVSRAIAYQEDLV